MNLTLDAEAMLYCGRDMEDVEVSSMAVGTSAVFTERCPGKPTGNEDSAAVVPFGEHAEVLAVADGVGGFRAGDRASGAALRALQEAIEEAARGTADSSPALVRTAILDGIERANHAVQELGVGAATTLAVVEIVGRTIRPYHVGDSMILVAGRRGKVKLQTISHSPVGFAVESGYLDAADAMHHEDRHLVSNLIGTPEMRIEIGAPLELAPRDTLLLASDGLFDNLHLDEIVRHLRKGSLRDAVRQLVAEARRRMEHEEDGQPSKPDDLTVLAYRPREGGAQSGSRRSVEQA